jgi:outer membrane receptor protein involved in Fe transport
MSFGIGLTPSFVPNLRVQIDYYDIDIKDVISTVGADNVLLLCLNASQYCDRIHRDVNGSLWLSPKGYIVDNLSNTGELREKGVDFDLSYSYSLGKYGKLRANYIATVLNNFLNSPVMALPNLAYDCVGYYGSHCGTPNPKMRSTFHLTWATPWSGLDVTLGWRHFDAVKLDQLASSTSIRSTIGGAAASDADLLSSGVVSNTDAKLAARDYIDLSASMDLGKGLTMRVGANNLLDKSPPIFGASNCGGGCNGNTFASVYDVLGRYVFATVTAQF